ncbi:hypothetical protein [Hymenobacter sp. B81]|uniref:hypothetical protein n=1 Tax=Hymenobacter sp. B81 TaxID=3344878 RepID=UPI0037DDB12A
MADINIQRKKKSVSPWLILLPVLALLALAAWYLLREDSRTAPTENAPTEQVAVPEDAARPEADTDALAGDADPAAAAPTEGAAPADFYAFVADDPAAPGYARRGLGMLSTVLVALADRGDLRDAAVAEKRDDLTSATSRLDEPNASLRPGLVAAADLMRAMQQRGYSTLEGEVSKLREQATQLSGRTETPADQQATQAFFQQAANVLRVLEKPAA